MAFKTRDAVMGPIQTDPEEGFVDVEFAIVDVQSDDRTVSFTLRRSYGVTPYGFKVIISRFFPWGLKAGETITINESGWVPDAVQFKSIGDESYNFVRDLASAYGVDVSPLPEESIIDPLAVSGFCFAEDDADLLALPKAEIKLANEFEAPDEFYDTLYWEAFLNLFPEDGIAQLREKDEAYRSALVNTLANEWGMT